MTTVPQAKEGEVSILGVIFAVAPLYALRLFIVNPFLAATTVFPFVILMQASGTSAPAAYVSTLEFLTNLFFRTSLRDTSDANAIALFFIALFGLTLIITGIEKVFRHFDMPFSLDWRHAVAFMTLVFAICWYVTLGNPEMPEPIFLLLFYSFNLFSIFSYHVVGITFETLRRAQPKLAYFI